MVKKFIIVLIIIIIFIAVIFGANKLTKFLYKTDYSKIVEEYSIEYSVDKYLIYAVIKNESNFNKDATSHKEAKGLMQMMNATAEEIANKLNIDSTNIELYNEEVSIKLGTFYLGELLKKYDNYLIAIAAYNAGIGNVDSWISKGIIKRDGTDVEKIPFKETNNYVRKIAREYKIYKKIYEKKEEI